MIAKLIKNHPVIGYFLLAYLLSWSLELLLVANYHGWLNVPAWLHYLASFGPALAGIFMTLILAGRPGLADLGARLIRWRVGAGWLILGTLSPLGLAILAVLVVYLFTGTWPDFAAFGRVEYLGEIGPVLALLLWLVTFGFGEETGWRGFALPTLQKRYGFLTSTLLIGIVWAAWHIPAFFYKPQLMELGIGGFVGFSFGVISGSIVLGWLYNKASSSILVVGIWHALFDFITTSDALKDTAAIISTLVMVGAVIIVMLELKIWPFRPRTIYQPGNIN